MEGSGMGLFLIVRHWLNIPAAKLKRSQLNVCTVYVHTVYCVLFPTLWLKFVLGWPAISVST